jgi:extracellular elastinolytic metalloproteinase
MRYSLLASLVIGATVVVAHPAAKENAWKKNLNKRTLDLDQFRTEPNSVYKTSESTKSDAAALSLLKRSDYVETATELVKSVYPDAEFRVTNNYVGTNGVSHVYLKQTIHGLDVDNSDFNVNVSSQPDRGNTLSRTISILTLLSRLPRMVPSSLMAATSTPERFLTAP